LPQGWVLKFSININSFKQQHGVVYKLLVESAAVRELRKKQIIRIIDGCEAKNSYNAAVLQAST
jgi:hypothetical protein